MWIKMLDEEIRETTYVANQAGIKFETTWNGENVGFQLFSYNDGYQPFLEKVFEEIKEFKPTQQLFDTKKIEAITNIKNKLMAEPYQRSFDYM